MTFEESLQRLDEIIETLGGGRSTLEDSLALYEEGVLLLRTCEKRLADAHTKLETLSDLREDG